MKTFFLVFILVMSACSTKNYEQTKSKIITIKTPKLRYSDLGFIRNTQKDLRVELFSAGVMVQKISINYLVCVNEGCLSRSAFNKQYLNLHYPNDILQNIFLAREIYGGKNLLKTDHGFEQTIQTDNVNIIYRVNADTIYFKDKKNGILFKIRDVQ
jgi:hypothetical protein